MLRARGALMLPALAFGALVVLVTGALVVGVGGGADSDASATDGSVAETTTTETTARSRGATVVRPAIDGSLEGPTVLVSAAVPYGTPMPIVANLPRRTVLFVTASGFPPSAIGRVEQCGVGGCANDFPVIFDANGETRFQY